MNAMNWLLARLREPSTYRGLVWLATACGVTLRPEVWEQVMTLGMALAGLIGVLTRDPLPHVPPDDPKDDQPKEPDHPVDPATGWNG